MYNHKILNIASAEPSLQKALSKELDVSLILTQLLINRGIKNAKEAKEFLHPDLNSLLDPFSFQEMPKAVEIIKKAAKDKEKVMLFSDYDVDGVTALTLLKETLSKMGLETTHYIPNRVKEGYGLNKNAIHLAKEKKVRVFITADCGTNSHEHIKELERAGIKVIITDHHEPINPEKSCASATINPKIKDSHYKFKELAGVGVAYKLCQAVSGETLEEDLDLVSLGTLADAVPLIGENRIIVREGLARIPRTQRLGLRALMQTSGIKDREISPYFVNFILAPRLNASGRMANAELSLKLLMSSHRDEASQFAQEIELHNRQRQKVENAILEEAEDLVNKEVNFKEHKVLVLAKEGWHSGVLGVVASKLTDRFYRPTILISLTHNTGKGSGRSIKNFHLFQGLLECQDLLESFGGHKHAVGLVIDKDNIADFKTRINQFAQSVLHFEDLLPSFDIDMELSLSDLNREIIGELERLEPFGVGNPEPLFYTRNLRLKGETRVLGRDTLKFWVSDGDLTYPAIGFGMGSFNESLLGADNFDLVYSPKIDSWQDDEQLILEIKDIFFR